MKIHRSKLMIMIALATAAISTGSAQEPVLNVGSHHGNLEAAQELVRQAYDRLSEAQAANNDKLGGHASRAKELLLQANDEIKLAAEAANQH